jgi:hypothetical protein
MTPTKRKFRLVVDLIVSQDEVTRLQLNSIERFMTTAIECGKILERNGSESGSILAQDGEELKPLLIKIWAAFQTSAFKIKEMM